MSNFWMCEGCGSAMHPSHEKYQHKGKILCKHCFFSDVSSGTKDSQRSDITCNSSEPAIVGIAFGIIGAACIGLIVYLFTHFSFPAIH